MYEKLIISDTFYYLLTALFGGLFFVYVIKKLLFSSSKISEENPVKSESKSKPKVLNSTNNNHHQNGRAIKLKETKNGNNSINNNEPEVTEEVIKSEKCVKPLNSELSISSDHSFSSSGIESNGKTTDDEAEDDYKQEVIETVTKTALNSLKSVKQSQKVSDLAAIILTDDNRKDWFEIVCITSGSDVIDAENLIPEFVVVDCRAPVLARRCLIRYLYNKVNELVKHEVSEEESLFAAIPASNRFELKNNYKFSLFLSEPPDNCAVGSTFRTNGSKNGTNKSGSNLIRLKSTTDKISVWNQVGIQGSLLSHFIDAIFISRVIIPVEFNEMSFHQHFILNYTKEPKLSKCDNNLIADITERISRVRVNGRQNVAVNWIKTEDSLEFIDCKTGKAIKDVTTECTSDGLSNGLSISRLSKHELNKCFRDFLTNYEHNLRPHQSLPLTYRKWKESAPNYRIQKQLLKVRYAVAGRQWICLPSDLDMFV